MNLKSSDIRTSGFSLASVLVGVALLSVSAVIISNTVIDARRAQKVGDLKVSSNKLQQAIIDAVTSRVKEFAIDNCIGARWSTSTSLTDIQKAFSTIPLAVDSTGTVELRFTNNKGDIPISTCPTAPVPTTLGAGESLSFCMEVNPPGAGVERRLLELLIVPVDLASDQAIKCADAQGAGSGAKIVWQLHSQINNKTINSSTTTTTQNQKSLSFLKESGVLLVSLETESSTGICNVSASRVGFTDQCTITARGLGRRPPKLQRKSGASTTFDVVTGFTWSKGAASDEFTVTTTCSTSDRHIYRAQSSLGSDACESAPVPPALICQSLTATRDPCNPSFCTVKITKGGTAAATAIIPGAASITQSGAVYTGTNVSCAAAGATLTGSLQDSSGGSVSCTPASVIGVGPSIPGSVSGLLANTRWWGANTSGPNQTTRPPVEIFAGQMSGATSLNLTSSSGTSWKRIFPGWGICGRQDTSAACPTNWRVTFLNAAGAAIGNGDFSPNACIPVPPGTTRAFVGFVDGSYWDNEGCDGGGGCNHIRRRRCSSTNGCTFGFSLNK